MARFRRDGLLGDSNGFCGGFLICRKMMGLLMVCFGKEMAVLVMVPAVVRW